MKNKKTGARRQKQLRNTRLNKMSKKSIPNLGSVYAMVLQDGRYGACRIIRRMTEKESSEFGGDCLLVVASSYIGKEIPDISNPEIKSILHVTHHSWNNHPEYIWISIKNRIPETFIKIGDIAPSPEELKFECYSYSSWLSLPFQVLLQWRWDNDREKLLNEENEINKKKELEIFENKKRYKEKLLKDGLAGLQKKKHFKNWIGNVSSNIIKESQAILKNCINELLIIESSNDESSKLNVLKRCIEEFNTLDLKHDHFITTIEREDICEEFDEIVMVCGLEKYENLTDNWRDW
jgi:hypothetical protein